MNLKTILTLIFLFSINFLFIQFSFAQNETEPSANSVVNPIDSTNPASPPAPSAPEIPSLPVVSPPEINVPEVPNVNVPELNAPPIEAPGPMKVLTPPTQATEQNPDPLPETTTHAEGHPIAPSDTSTTEEANKVAKNTCNGIDDCTGCMDRDKKIVKVFCCTSSKKRSENHEYAKGCSRAEIENSN